MSFLDLLTADELDICLALVRADISRRRREAETVNWYNREKSGSLLLQTASLERIALKLDVLIAHGTDYTQLLSLAEAEAVEERLGLRK